MKKATATKNPISISRSLAPLIEQVRSLVQSARQAAAASVNSLQVLTNFEIGRLIVEHEQQGRYRAAYGKETLVHLSASLTAEFGRGFSRANLEYMRNSTSYGRIAPFRFPRSLLGNCRQLRLARHHLGNLPAPFTLSWSHYVLLLTIKNSDERSFYEIEATQSGWSVPELKRQLNSGLYERLALSRNKKQVRMLAEEGHTVTQASDMLKDPFVLEFLGLDEKPAYSETDLESALIDKLQHFLLELGKGFLFEARQKRFTFDEDHYFVDLVFYNRLLRCYVLVDLKLDKLTHQDLGQMQMYVNYFDRFVKTPDENPTVGMLLCKRKKTAIIELTLPKNANIFASQYQLYLPSKEDLKQRLMEWTEEVGNEC